MPQEKSSEINPFDFVEHGIEARNLADVIADDVEQAAGNVRLAESFFVLISRTKLTK